MFCLRNQICCDGVGIRRFVGQYDNFAWSCDAVDVDIAEDSLLRQCDKQVSRANDLVDSINAVDPVRQRSNGLSAADAEAEYVDLVQALVGP